MRDNYLLETPALLLSQTFGEFVVASISAQILLEIAYSDRLKAISEPDGSYHLEGSQRELMEPRLRAIGRYIDKGSAAFPNSIILAGNYREEDGLIEDDPDLRWKFINGENGTGLLRIPSSNKLAAIIDGQHRLFGFNYITVRERLQMPLICAVYFDLPKTYQAFLFAAINSNQKAVDKSQTYELFGYNVEKEPPESWTPEKFAVFLARKLNTEKDSPFYWHISIPAESDHVKIPDDINVKDRWKISTSTVVEGIIKLISNNPKNDAYEMDGTVFYKRGNREDLKPSKNPLKTPMRDLFIIKSDDLIFAAVKNYFLAVQKILWDKGNSTSYLTRTVGIQALFDILRDIAPEAVKLKNFSEAYFSKVLMPCENLDFSDEFFSQASGTGRLRIRNSLQLCLGIKEIEDMRLDNQYEGYKRVCRLKDDSL